MNRLPQIHCDEDWTLNGLIVRKKTGAEQDKNTVGDVSPKSRTLCPEGPMQPTRNPRLLGYSNTESCTHYVIEDYSEKDDKCSCRFLSI